MKWLNYVVSILWAYAMVLGFRGSGFVLDKSDAPMHVLADLVAAPALGAVIDFGALVAMFACILACVTASARILLLMAHHGLVPMHLSRTHRRNDTPHLAVVLAAIVTGLPPLQIRRAVAPPGRDPARRL